MNILVTYASRYGSTQEIAETVARVLNRRGEHATVRPVDDVPSLDSYDAVVLGSAVYEGDWLPGATDFARRFAELLEHLPVWLFSSGVAGDAPTETMHDWKEHPKLVNTLITNIHPQDSVLFGGRFDPKHLDVGDWWRYPSMRGLKGDFRDWQQIETWAEGIADALSSTETRVETASGVREAIDSTP